ncbi:hypothetical protein LUX29_11810 [Aureimonas altamirensis]|uniref:hypothetical protein n=1 Tax=Aureimonas altamirensis TaxID=370622 RepID=UPI001E5F74E2|nr:hypothetical protein [Aureimonas altamirensis]UHD43789.1 hypothetical protein LUX29_11810 [Aureimonas altamirensis]
MVTVPVMAPRKPKLRLTRAGLTRPASILSTIGWAILSIGLFAGLWELAWAMGWADPLLLPPPHLFLSNFERTLSFFSNRNQIGVAASGGGIGGLLTTSLYTTLRVVCGLALGFVGGVTVGALVHYVPSPASS